MILVVDRVIFMYSCFWVVNVLFINKMVDVFVIYSGWYDNESLLKFVERCEN